MTSLAKKFLHKISIMATQSVITKLSAMIQSRMQEEYSKALECLAAFSYESDANIMMWAIQDGLFPSLFEIINTGVS